ncbi:hypothetical protein, partial [Methylobacterium oxalidis]|uniref:hypothetical protein n=1 Tax=Methylobacterium oxalidis TaxID=944322 RepID=UPI0033158D69
MRSDRWALAQNSNDDGRELHQKARQDQAPSNELQNVRDPDPGFDNVVLDWNQIALDAIRRASITNPPEDAPYVSRALAMQSIAMFDVLQAIADRPGF